MGLSCSQVLLICFISLQIGIIVLWILDNKYTVVSFMMKNFIIPKDLPNSFWNISESFQRTSENTSLLQINSVEVQSSPNTKADDPLKGDWPPNVRICFRRQECIQGKTKKTTCDFVMRDGQDVCAHLMTVIRKPSRTGNQMFQVAAMIGIAKINGFTPVIPKNFDIKNIFDLPNVADLEFDNNAYFDQKGSKLYSKSINHLNHAKNWTLTGFLQSWKYFFGSESIIRKVFTFKEKFSSAAKAFLQKVTPDGFKAICIHVRCFKKTPKNVDYYTPSPQYIERAVDYFRKLFDEKTVFIFLSEDKSWVKANIKMSGSKYSPFREPGSDLALMAYCDHVVLTAGTFGWWGAWLSGGKVVYWKTFVNTRAKYQKDFTNAYYPNDWIGME